MPECESLQEPVAHFHGRYQDKKLFKNLMHEDKREVLAGLLAKDLATLSYCEKINMLLIVIHRFRNNIFHGNKSVKSWLTYKVQINLCITAMQTFIDSSTTISHKEE
jgi:hypothetical protein